MTRRPVLLSLALLTSVSVLAACSSDSSDSTDSTTDSSSASSSPAEATEGVTVVATTTFMGDLAGQIVACGGGNVTTLMPIGADPHDFSASSEQVAAMVTADLVVANGLGLESGLADALETAQADGATVLSIGELVDPLPASDAHGAEEAHSDEETHTHEETHTDEEAHDHGDFDPHIWYDMQRMATAAQLIGEELATITGDATYTTCGAEVAESITATETEVSALLTSVPADKRILVTDHLAYGYLADRYGYEVVGAVVPSITTDAEPSSADLAELVDVINAEGVNVIFVDVASPSVLADAVAAETGRDVKVVALYEGSLGGPDTPAATYQDFMLSNATLISENLTN